MQLTREEFYQAENIAIMPMGFCYPGTGKSGDLPPRKECAQLWHKQLLQQLPNIELTLLVGQYAQNYYLGKETVNNKPMTLTARVKQWRQYLPHYLPLPHPSPRNQRWLKNNPWFLKEVIPELQKRLANLKNTLINSSMN